MKKAQVVLFSLMAAAALNFSCAPKQVPLFEAPITEQAVLDKIVQRINQEGVNAVVGADGIITVQDEKTARRMRAILVREDHIPQLLDPWQIFNRDRWTWIRTDLR